MSQRWVFILLNMLLNYYYCKLHSWIMLRWAFKKISTGTSYIVWKLNYSKTGPNSFSWCCLNFFSLLCSFPVHYSFLPPKDTHIFQCLNEWVGFLMSSAMQRVKFAGNVFPVCSSSSYCSEPTHLQDFCASIFLLRFFLFHLLPQFQHLKYRLVKNSQHYYFR